ncbi:hypothetical protein [Aquamicrobium sp. LC103]|uniref:hypothetical protein n=1 Tax=Aquamicrobium sp. LC103 TaxID=1120658 RepID=UPI00063E8ADE|nr:hypothetical protein [Aquamicrobium sp. LC103]
MNGRRTLLFGASMLAAANAIAADERAAPAPAPPKAAEASNPCAGAGQTPGRDAPRRDYDRLADEYSSDRPASAPAPAPAPAPNPVSSANPCAAGQ